MVVDKKKRRFNQRCHPEILKNAKKSAKSYAASISQKIQWHIPFLQFSRDITPLEKK